MSFSDLPTELVRGIFEEIFHEGWVKVPNWGVFLSLRLVCKEFDSQVKLCGLGSVPISDEDGRSWHGISDGLLANILQAKISKPHDSGSELIAKLQETAKSLNLFDEVADGSSNEVQTKSLEILCMVAAIHLGSWGVFHESTYKQVAITLAPAAAVGNVSLMHKLLENGADVNEVNGVFGNALCAAAIGGQGVAIRLLIEKGANIEYFINPKHGTAICQAAMFGQDSAVRVLLEKGAKLDFDPGERQALHFAMAGGGHEAVVVTLLRNGAGIDAKTSRGETALCYAVKIGDREAILNILLKEGADIEAKDNKGRTPLFLAAKEKREEIIKFLLGAGANIQATDNTGETILHRLVRDQAPTSLISLFISNGININVQNGSGETALHLAVLGRQFDVVNLLLESKADVQVAAADGATALIKAVDQNSLNESLIKLLLRYGANVSAHLEDGRQALHISAARGQEEIPRLLLEAGANINAIVKDGATPLHAASSDGSATLILLLLSHGALVNMQTTEGVTPLHLAAKKENLDILSILLEHGANPKLCTTNLIMKNFHRIEKGTTALHLAVSSCPMVNTLLRHGGSEIEARDDRGRTVFFRAAIYGADDTLQCLVAHGADVNTVDNDGDTVLHISASNSARTQLLLSLGVTPMTRNVRGETPLHLAASGYNTVLRLLLDHRNADDNSDGDSRADIDARDVNGKTALHVAASWSNGHQASMMVLVEGGADLDVKDREGMTAMDYFGKAPRPRESIEAIIASLEAVVRARGGGDGDGDA